MPGGNAIEKLKERHARSRDSVPPSPCPSDPSTPPPPDVAPPSPDSPLDALKRRRNASRAQSASAVLQRSRTTPAPDDPDDDASTPDTSTPPELSLRSSRSFTNPTNPPRSLCEHPQALPESELESSSNSNSRSYSTSASENSAGSISYTPPSALDDPSAELDRVIIALQRVADASHRQINWEEQHGALESATSLATSHPDVVRRRAQELVRAAEPSLKSLRSGVAKQALVMLREISSAAGSKLDCEAHNVVPALCKQCGEQGFLAAEADKALTALTTAVSKPRAIAALLSVCTHPSWQVRRKAAHHLENALSIASEQISSAHNGKKVVCPDEVVSRVAVTVASLLGEGNQHCRTLAKRSLFHLVTISGGRDQLLRHIPAEKVQQARSSLDDKRGMPEHPASPTDSSASSITIRGGALNGMRGSSAPPPQTFTYKRRGGGGGEKQSFGPSSNEKGTTITTRTRSDNSNGGVSFGSNTSTGAADWRQRLATVRESEAAVKRLVGESQQDAAANELIALARRAADGSPRVAIAALKAICKTVPVMPQDLLRRTMADHIPSLAGAAAAASDEMRSAASAALEAVTSSLGAEVASRMLANACQRGSARSRPALLRVLQSTASRDESEGGASKEALIKDALPTAFSSISDGRSRQAAMDLLQALESRIGTDTIMSRASRLPAPTQQKVANALR